VHKVKTCYSATFATPCTVCTCSRQNNNARNVQFIIRTLFTC